MQNLAADQLTDNNDLAWGVRGGQPPANMCHRRKIFWEVLAFTIFLCFFCPYCTYSSSSISWKPWPGKLRFPFLSAQLVTVQLVTVQHMQHVLEVV